MSVSLQLERSEEPALHPEPYQRDGTAGMQLPWNFPVDAISKSCQVVFTGVEALENRVQTAIRLGPHSSSNEGVNHGRSGWRVGHQHGIFCP